MRGVAIAWAIGAMACGAPVVAAAPDAAADASPSVLDAGAVVDASAPDHVLTWDYYDSQYGASSTAVAVATAAKWLSWADGNASTQLASFGVQSYLYSMPTGLAPSDEFYGALVESDFAHDCSNHRITLNNYANLYITDPHPPHLASAWKTWVAAHTGTYAAIFMDGADLPLLGEPLSASPCNYSEPDWQAAEVSMIDAIGRPVMFNGLWPRYNAGNWLPPATLPLLDDPNVMGARMEGCYSDPYNPSVHLKVVGSPWEIDENSQLTMAQKHKLLLCMAGFNTPTIAATAALDVRAYVLASFFLSYDPATSMLGEGYTTPTGFHVEPESQIVPLSPLRPPPADISGLLSGGVYVREFADCFLAGKRVSGCAAIVNSSATGAMPLPTLSRTYQHTMVLTGGGVLDGGAVAVDGQAPPPSIPAATGLVVFE